MNKMRSHCHGVWRWATDLWVEMIGILVEVPDTWRVVCVRQSKPGDPVFSAAISTSSGYHAGHQSRGTDVELEPLACYSNAHSTWELSKQQNEQWVDKKISKSQISVNNEQFKPLYADAIRKFTFCTAKLDSGVWNALSRYLKVIGLLYENCNDLPKHRFGSG